MLLLVRDDDGECWKSVDSAVLSVVGVFGSLVRWCFATSVLRFNDLRAEDRVEEVKLRESVSLLVARLRFAMIDFSSDRVSRGWKREPVVRNTSVVSW